MQTNISTMAPNAQLDLIDELSPDLLLPTVDTETTTLQSVSKDPKKIFVFYRN